MSNNGSVNEPESTFISQILEDINAQKYKQISLLYTVYLLGRIYVR